jgi:hypothetical protein
VKSKPGGLPASSGNGVFTVPLQYHDIWSFEEFHYVRMMYRIISVDLIVGPIQNKDMWQEIAHVIK